MNVEELSVVVDQTLHFSPVLERPESRLAEHHIAVRFDDVARSRAQGFQWCVTLDGEDVSRDVDEAFAGPAADDPHARPEFEPGWVYRLDRKLKQYRRIYGAVEIRTEPVVEPGWYAASREES